MGKGRGGQWGREDTGVFILGSGGQKSDISGRSAPVPWADFITTQRI